MADYLSAIVGDTVVSKVMASVLGSLAMDSAIMVRVLVLIPCGMDKCGGVNGVWACPEL